MVFGHFHNSSIMENCRCYSCCKKKSKPTVLNDYRPVALTAIAMKCFERIVKDFIVNQTKPFIDPSQFAYRTERSVEDAIVTLLHGIYSHLDRSKAYVRTLFVDFSSAFNMIQPHILLGKLRGMNVNPYLILWINDFLTNISQRVRLMQSVSDIVYTNIGAPSGMFYPQYFSHFIQVISDVIMPRALWSSMQMTLR